MDDGFSGEDFARRFACPDARIQAGQTYFNEFTRSTLDRGPEQAALSSQLSFVSATSAAIFCCACSVFP